jgi:hypothetical protein
MPNGAGDKTSLVLTGGGGYAAYEVGVMRALFNGETSTTNFEPFDPDLLIGTSAGAMNVAALAAAEVRTGNLIQAVDELRSAWLTVIAEGPDRCGNGVFRLRGFPTPLLDPNCLRGGPVPLLQELAADTANLMLEGVSMLSRMLEPNDSLVRRLAGSIDLTAVIETNPFQDTLKALIPLDDVARSTRKMRIVALDI